MLKRLTLKNFRNHTQFSIEIPSSGMIIIGPNGSGKTSILESIYALSTTRPFRARQSQIFVKKECEVGEITGETEKDLLEIKWQVSPRKKTLLRQNEIELTASEYLERKNFFAILFSPEDLYLPFDAPQKRRRFLNRILLTLDPNLFQSYQRFEKILVQRNALLRRIDEGKAKREELEFYDQEFAKESEKITKNREQFFQEISPLITKNYTSISSKEETLEVEFRPSVSENVLQKLKENIEKDLHRGSTSAGAHHDDFQFLLRGEHLEESGSRGEVRSAILSFKMAEKKYIQEITKKHPIILLDDVFSELDSNRRKHLTEFVTGEQVIITATDMPARATEGVELKIVEL